MSIKPFDKEKKLNPILSFFNYSALGFYYTFTFLLTSIFHIFLYACKGIIFVLTSPKYLFKPKPFNDNKINKLAEKREELITSLSNEEDSNRGKRTITYKYKAKNKAGKMIKGNFTGFSRMDVNAYLVNEGYTVYSIEETKANPLSNNNSIFSRKLSNKDLIFWLTQLSTYIKSGIPLTDALNIIANQMHKGSYQKRIYEALIYDLNMGENFSRAMEKQGAIFPSLLINMLRAAEATGDLSNTLDDMAAYYTDLEKTRKQIVSALTYPTVILIFAIAVITFILLYVIPQFIDVYESMDAEITGIAGTIINISSYLKENILSLLLYVVLFIFVFIIMYQRVKNFRRTTQIILMKIPVIGNIIIYKEMTIFTKTFASLLKNSIFITDSIDILKKVTNNEVYKEIMVNTVDNIAKGEKISTAFKNHWAIPEVAYHMILTGESTGQLPDMMSRVSEYFADMSKSNITTLKSLIEPIMILILTAVVGTIILAVVLPMFGLYETIAL